MSIREFAKSYKDRNYPVNPLLMKKVFLTDVSSSTLVWDEDEYLVELYFMHPLIYVVPHSHPFESLIIFMGGHLLGLRADFYGSWLNQNNSGLICSTLPPGDWHGFQTGDSGAVVYSISRWDDPKEKDSATRKYLGDPLGPIHKITLDSMI